MSDPLRRKYNALYLEKLLETHPELEKEFEKVKKNAVPIHDPNFVKHSDPVLLCIAFNWELSPQGYAFWEKLYDTWVEK